MEQSFQKKILESIKNSGFPLELELVQKLRERKIITFPNISFQDSERYNHELDIVSIIYGDKSTWKFGVSGIQLLIECKRANKYPWVFFEEVHNPLNYGLASKIDFCSDFSLDQKEFNPLIGSLNSDSHHYNQVSLPISRTYFEAFKEENNNTSQIYKAVTSIFHGKRYLKNWFDKSRISSIEKGRAFLNHFAIVLDGSLILATKDGTDFKLKEVDHVILKTVDTLSNNNKSLMGEEIIIDIIRKDYFSSYLDLLNDDVKFFSSHLDKIKHSNINIK